METEINALRARSPMHCTAIALMRPMLLADLLGRRCDSMRV